MYHQTILQKTQQATKMDLVAIVLKIIQAQATVLKMLTTTIVAKDNRYNSL